MTATTTAATRRRSWTTVLNGRRLRELRREHGLSQEALADRAGISLATVARLERQSRAACRGRTLARLAAALDEDTRRDRPFATGRRHPGACPAVSVMPLPGDGWRRASAGDCQQIVGIRVGTGRHRHAGGLHEFT